MEHELFQSKLKPCIEGGLVLEIIRNSSSGLDSHRTAAMELLFERSIQGRRERMFTKVKDSLPSNPIPQSKGIGEGPIIPTSEVKPAAPAWHAPRPPQLLPSDTSPSVSTRARSALVNHETPRDPSKPARKPKVARFEDPPGNAGVNWSPPKDVVQLLCRKCSAVQPRSHFRSRVFCGTCFGKVNCTGCGAFRISDTEACTNCYRNFS